MQNGPVQPVNSYKIQPIHGIGDTPFSVVFRILGRAANIAAKVSGILVAIGVGGATFPWSLGLGFAAWKLGGLIDKSCFELASLADIDKLLSKQDMIAIRHLIGDGKYLSEKVKKYDKLADVPEDLRKELTQYMEDHYYSIRQLKNAIATTQIVTKKKERATIEINVN